MGVGRPRIFETPADLEQAWNLYKRETQEEKNDWIDKTGFCQFINCYPDIISNLAKRQEFTGTINLINEDCKRDLIRRGLLNEYNANMAKFVLSADYGMAEKTDNKNNNHNVNESFEDYRKRLDAEIEAAIKEKNG